VENNATSDAAQGAQDAYDIAGEGLDRHSQAHIRLGLRPEIHRAEEHCPPTGAYKGRILGAVFQIFRLDYLPTRHLESFAPRGVQRHSRGDGGCDFQ
jgi:hypothetical protein